MASNSDILLRPPHVPGEAPDRPRTVLPAEIVGLWAVGDTNFEFTVDGKYYIIGPPVVWNVSADGQILTIKTTEYQRKHGSGRSIVGTWSGEKMTGVRSLYSNLTARIWTSGMMVKLTPGPTAPIPIRSPLEH